MKMQKYWYLGFLGLIGFYKAPTIWAVIADGAHWMGLSNLLWFLWLFYFVPQTTRKDTDA